MLAVGMVGMEFVCVRVCVRVFVKGEGIQITRL